MCGCCATAARAAQEGCGLRAGRGGGWQPRHSPSAHPQRSSPAPSPSTACTADCQHVNDFFRRAGVATLTVRELFDFVVDPSLANEGAALDAELDRLMEMAVRWVGRAARTWRAGWRGAGQVALAWHWAGSEKGQGQGQGGLQPSPAAPLSPALRPAPHPRPHAAAPPP